MKLPILVKISRTIIEILTINKWSSKVDRFQRRDVDHVVERFVDEWFTFDMHEIISAVVTQWPAHLHACIEGGRTTF